MKFLAAALLIATPSLFSEVRAMDAVDPTAALVRGNRAFALQLYTRLGQGDGNRFLSPFSISAALAMTYAGAQDQTALEIAQTLHFDLSPDQLHAAFHSLLAKLHSRSTTPSGSKEGPDVQLVMANALWTQAGERILADFRKRLEVNYRGGLYPVDFRGATEEARRTINAWVEEQTRGKIKDLLKPAQVPSSTLLILTNAIYFKALWAAPFRADHTRPGDFHVSAGDKVRVDLMNLTDRFGYLDGGSFQALELPYKGNTLAMVVFLPKAPDGLASFESDLTLEKLDTWLTKLASHRVQVSLPRFKLTGEFDLKDALSGLGMPSAFQLGVADFSGMTGTRDFAISAVVHKAFVEVEERGTEAAAATGVVMSATAVVATPPVIFQADHPFFFLIRDVRTGSILFLGRLVRPEA